MLKKISHLKQASPEPTDFLSGIDFHTQSRFFFAIVITNWLRALWHNEYFNYHNLVAILNLH